MFSFLLHTKNFKFPLSSNPKYYFILFKYVKWWQDFQLCSYNVSVVFAWLTDQLDDYSSFAYSHFWTELVWTERFSTDRTRPLWLIIILKRILVFLQNPIYIKSYTLFVCLVKFFRSEYNAVSECWSLLHSGHENGILNYYQL